MAITIPLSTRQQARKAVAQAWGIAVEAVPDVPTLRDLWDLVLGVDGQARELYAGLVALQQAGALTRLDMELWESYRGQVYLTELLMYQAVVAPLRGVVDSLPAALQAQGREALAQVPMPRPFPPVYVMSPAVGTTSGLSGLAGPEVATAPAAAVTLNIGWAVPLAAIAALLLVAGAVGITWAVASVIAKAAGLNRYYSTFSENVQARQRFVRDCQASGRGYDECLADAMRLHPSPEPPPTPAGDRSVGEYVLAGVGILTLGLIVMGVIRG